MYTTRTIPIIVTTYPTANSIASLNFWGRDIEAEKEQVRQESREQVGENLGDRHAEHGTPFVDAWIFQGGGVVRGDEEVFDTVASPVAFDVTALQEQKEGERNHVEDHEDDGSADD